MKTFRIVLWSGIGDGEITVEIEAPNSLSACQYIEDSLCWSFDEVEDSADEDDE